MLSITSITYIMQVRGVPLPLVVYAGHCDLWLAFFMIGIAMRRFDVRYSLRWPLVLVAVSWVWQVAESYYLYSLNGGGLGIKLSSFVFSAAVLSVLFHPSVAGGYREGSRLVTGIRRLGRISFGVYLIHCFFIHALSAVGLREMPWGLLWALVLLASVVSVWVLKRVFPRSLNQYLGF
nr:acyltransferase family protein [uncultured Parabacteroides sp.]